MNIRIPKGFFDDHMDRGLPTPLYKPWRSGYVVSLNDPNFAELMSDAEYYAHDVDACSPGLIRAAKALIKTVDKEKAFLQAIGKGMKQDGLL